MTEKLIVQNFDPCNAVVFSVYSVLGSDQLEGMNLLKRKKAFRSSKQVIKLAPNSHVDLVAATGLSVADLKSNPELCNLLAKQMVAIVEE